MILEDHPARLLNAVMERMNDGMPRAVCSRLGRIEHLPKIPLKVLVYGYMRKKTSSRRLEGGCGELVMSGLLSLEAAFIDGTKQWSAGAAIVPEAR